MQWREVREVGGECMGRCGEYMGRCGCMHAKEGI